MLKKIDFRVVLTLIVMVMVLFWAFSSTRQSSYSGENLNIPVGNGPTVITNDSSHVLTVQLAASGTRSAFSITSPDAGIPTRATREGSGRNTRHFIDFEVPPGTTQFQVSRGNGITLTTTGQAPVQVVAAPLNEGEVQMTMIIAGVVILIGMVYLSHTTEHSWLKWIRASNITLSNETTG